MGISLASIIGRILLSVVGKARMLTIRKTRLLPWFMGDQTTVGGSDLAGEGISVVGSRKYMCRSCAVRSVVFDETQEKCCFCAVTSPYKVR